MDKPMQGQHMQASTDVTPSDKRVLYSGFRWATHDEVSGYHHVVASKADYVDGETLWGGKSPLGSRARRINFLLIDLVTIVRAIPYRSVLLFYPEQTAYISAPILRLMGKKVVYAVHLGEDYWFHRDDSFYLKIKRFNLRFVSKFISLTDQQKEVFEAHFPGKVAKIPHGTWCPPVEAKLPVAPDGKIHLAVIGDNYRDYGFIADIIERFRVTRPNVVFDLVGMKYEKLGEARHSPNAICHKRLDGVQYREVIRNSLFLLLPLEFATANNALLEGLVEGVPVLCSNVHGVREYLPSGDYVFESIDDVDAQVEARSQMTPAQHAAEAATLQAYVRHNYSWETVRKGVVEYCIG